MKGISRGKSLNISAMGIELSTPQMAPLLVAFFQNSPIKKTAKIPGLTNPVYSCIYWNIWSMFPNMGAIKTAIIKEIPAVKRPTLTNFVSEAVLLM